jgi:hypothetical protein
MITNKSQCLAETKTGKRCKIKCVTGQNVCHRHQQHGTGIVDSIRKRIKAMSQGPRTTETKRLKEFLEANNDKIKSIKLGRKPVMSTFKSIVNALSFGKFDQIRKKLNYDQIFHNYLLVELDNGKIVKLERNHIIEAKAPDASDYDLTFDVPVTKDLTMKDMISNASAGNDRFNRYDPRDQNCQNFTQDMIVRNGLMPETESGIDAIKPQDSEQLIDSLGILRHIPKVITDTAATLDRGIYGDGLTKPKFGIELSNFEIDKFLKPFGDVYGGCFSKDNLIINDAKKNKCYVLNLDAADGPGTHWVGLYNVDPTYCVYIDPFGQPCPEHVLKFMKATGKKALYMDIDLQSIKSSSCGWFAVCILTEMIRGRKLTDILYDDFTANPEQNELILKKYFI